MAPTTIIQVIVKLCNSIINFRLKTVIHSMVFFVHNNNPRCCTSFVALGTWLHLYGDNVLTTKEQPETNNNSRPPLICNWSERSFAQAQATKYTSICSPRTRLHCIVNHENKWRCVCKGSQSVTEEHTPKRPPPHRSWDNSYQRNIRLIKYTRDMEGDLVDKGQGTRIEHMGN